MKVMANKLKVLEHLNIPRSSFYYISVLEEKDLSLKKKIEEVLESNPSYGHKRIALELNLNKKRIRRVMKKYNIRPRRKRRKPYKSRNNEKSVASPNLLVSLFPLYKNHIWITDFTYLKWRSGWVYVCTVIDLYTREVLGISIKTNHSSLLVSEALLNALQTKPSPLLIHSDQGSEYKSRLFRMSQVEKAIRVLSVIQSALRKISR